RSWTSTPSSTGPTTGTSRSPCAGLIPPRHHAASAPFALITYTHHPPSLVSAARPGRGCHDRRSRHLSRRVVGSAVAETEILLRRHRRRRGAWRRQVSRREVMPNTHGHGVPVCSLRN